MDERSAVEDDWFDRFPMIQSQKPSFSSLASLMHTTARQLGGREELQALGILAESIRHAIAPYRICPLGAHVDHQGGTVLGRTIDAYSVLAFAPLPGPEVRLHSANYPGAAFFKLDDVGQVQVEGGDFGDWSRYARGAAYVLGQRFRLEHGISGAISGTLPGGGLSSSASAGLAYLAALAAANDLSLSHPDLIELDRQLENDYLGLRNGILDQSTIVHGRRDALLFIDTRDQRVSAIPDPPEALGCRFLIAYSGYSRALTATEFNDRVQECCQAARLLGRHTGQKEAWRLSDISAAGYQRYQDELSAHLSRRAAHYFDEVARVEAGCRAWREGDMARFGALMDASCRSSIFQYECGSGPLIDLHEIVSSAPGVYGSRFSGGGYGGCVVGLAGAEAAPEAIADIERRYRAAYPEVAGRAGCYVASVEEGLRLL